MLDIVLGFICFGVCIYFLRRLRSRFELLLSFNFIVTAFTVRVLAGVFLTYLYTYYYPDRLQADTFRYFDDSCHLHKMLFAAPLDYATIMLGGGSEVRFTYPLLEETLNWFQGIRSPLYNDNRTIVRTNTIIQWISFGSYYVHMCVFVFMGFVGQMIIFKTFQKYVKGKVILFGFVIFMIPSLVFWTSSILKEGPLFLALGFLLRIMEKIMRKSGSKKDLFFIILLFLFLFQMKFYVGLMLLPIFSLYYVLGKWPKVNRFKLVLINYGSYFGAALLWHIIRFKWSLFTVFKWKKRDFMSLAETMDAKSYMDTYVLEDTPLSFLANIPQGLFNSLFRPFIWEVYNPVILMSALENLLLISFMSFCVYWRKRERVSNLALCTILYATSLLAIVGMVTPIMGSLVRYKIPALPFLLLFFLMILDVDKLKQKFPRLQKV